MYIQKEKGFPVVQGDFSLAHKLADASKKGLQLPDMSTPPNLGDQPLLPENERFMESADLYGLECSTKKKFGNLKDKYEKHLSFVNRHKEREV